MAEETVVAATNDESKPAVDPSKQLVFERDSAAAKALKLEKELAELRRQLPSPDQLTKWQEAEVFVAKSLEDKKRKEGEFDSWRVDITKKHEDALNEERKRAADVATRLHTTLKDHAFASASDWFGGSDAKTILTPAIASAYFGRYVAVEEHDGAERVVVRDPNGHAILDTKTGKPAAFAQAIGELIGMLPDRDSVLRGSGKTGSGSSGGSHGTQTPDLAELTKRASRGDKDAITALRRQQSSLGGITFGDGRMVS